MAAEGRNMPTAGPFIIPLECRLGTYDRLLAAPVSLLTPLVSKAAVGVLFAIAVSSVALLVGALIFGVDIPKLGLLIAGQNADNDRAPEKALSVHD
jgi:ABC-type multidrug transport system permease subunit